MIAGMGTSWPLHQLSKGNANGRMPASFLAAGNVNPESANANADNMDRRRAMDSGLAAAWRPGMQDHDATCLIFKQPRQSEGKPRPPAAAPDIPSRYPGAMRHRYHPLSGRDAPPLS